MIANRAIRTKCTVLAIVHYKLNFELHMLCSYTGQDLYTAWDSLLDFGLNFSIMM